MIVRNEERVLERCLRSVQSLHPEIVICDTGSTDRTVEIAVSMGAIVGSAPRSCLDEKGRLINFSSARNASIQIATGSWILVLDADDVLEAGHDEIQSAIQSETIQAYAIPCQDGNLAWDRYLLFRNRPEHRYGGWVHECVTTCLPGGRLNGVRVAHHPDRIGKEPSGDRNLRINQAWMQAEPANTRCRFYYANGLREAGRHQEAIDQYAIYQTLRSPFDSERTMGYYYSALCHFYMKQWTDALEQGYQALQRDPRRAEFHCLLGDIYSWLGQWDTAKVWYRSALVCGFPRNETLFIDRSRYYDYPALRLREMEERGQE